MADHAPLRVRVVPLRRNESYFLRQVAIDRPGGTVQLDDLRALRHELDEHLRMQLYFTVKMKFEIEHSAPDGNMDDDGNIVGPETYETYLFSPAPWVVAPDADVERRLTSIEQTAREKLLQHLEAAALRGSGDLIGGIRQVYILVSPGAEMARLPPAPAVGNQPVGTFVRLPPELERKKCFWNPQTTDHSCFAWCIRAALLGVENLDCEKRRRLARLTDSMLFQEGYAPVPGQHKKHRAEVLPRNFGFDFSCLPAGDRGVTWNDIEEFERINGHRLRIFVWEWCKVEWRQQTVYETVFERVIVREPKLMNHPFEKEIHLLRHENHFFYIWNYNAFMSNQGARLQGTQRPHHHALHVCPCCRAGFQNERNLELHRQTACSFDPSKRGSALRMPGSVVNGSLEELVFYNPGASAELAPLVMYTDLEVESQAAPTEQVAQHTVCLQENVLSAAYAAVGRNGYVPKKQAFLTTREVGEHRFAAVERMLTEMRREGERYLLWKKRTNVPPRLTAEEQRTFDEADRCSTCKIFFEAGHEQRQKVCHHEHGTGRFRGPLCKRCNGKIVQPRTIPVMLHNGGSFDFRFILRCLAWMRRRSQDEVKANLLNLEQLADDELYDYLESFSDDESEDEDAIPKEQVEEAMEDKPWHELKLSVLFKTGEKMLSFRIGCLCFIDSMNFYKASLGSLMDDLKKTNPDNPSQVFRLMSEIHPELQEAALTEDRCRRLHQYFEPERSFEEIDKEQFSRWTWELLLRKLPMPFERMCGPEIWQLPPVWHIDAYRSSLNGDKEEDLRNKHKLLRETCEVLGFEDFRRVHNTYLFMDLCLADVIETFRTVFHARFGLDPAQFVSLPSAAYEAMLRGCLTRKRVRRVTSLKIYECLRDVMMGGLSAIFTPHRRANSPELGDHYDPEKPHSYFLTLDVSSMYPAIMCEPMPVDGGTFVHLPDSGMDRIKWAYKTLSGIDYMGSKEKESFLFVVDYSFPLEKHDQIDWPPPCRMSVSRDQLSPFTQELMAKNGLQCSKVPKLVPFLGAHKEEGVDGKRLAFLVSVLGARLDKVHRVIKFRCEPFLASWIKSCYDDRLELKRQGRGVEAEMLKLVMNSMYGKLVQRCEQCRCSKVFTDGAKFVRAANGHRMCDLDWFGEDEDFMAVVQDLGRVVVQKSLVQTGHRVLELSRLMMMKYHYLGVKKLFPQALPMSTDTDSAAYYIECAEDPMHAMAAANETGGFPCYFDLAKDLVGKKDAALSLQHLTPRQQEIAFARAGELGGFGMEYLPVRIVEQIGLRAKLYSILFSEPLKGKCSKQRAKGVMKRVMPGHEDFAECMNTGYESSVDFTQMVSHHFHMAVERRRKKALSPFNDKVYQLDSESARPLGHWRNSQCLTALVNALDPAGKPFQLIMMYLQGRADFEPVHA